MIALSKWEIKLHESIHTDGRIIGRHASNGTKQQQSDHVSKFTAFERKVHFPMQFQIFTFV